MLRSTLECLIPHVRRHELAVKIGENVALSDGIKAAVDAFAAQCPAATIQLLDLVESVSDEPPLRRMLDAVDLLYDRIATPYVFHCEDDWWLSDEDFLTPSKAILEQFEEIKIVRLTGSEVRPFPDRQRRLEARISASSTVGFCLSRYGGPGGIYGAFTFNPGLRRLSDRTGHFGTYRQFPSEGAISKQGQRLGHREAILDQVFARHMGVGLTKPRAVKSPGVRSPARTADTRSKVFGIGMFKTGTTSFGEAMQILGYRARYRFIPLLDQLSGYFDLNPAQFDPFEAVIRREAERFDSFADAPWLFLYRRLSEWYPESTFVLTLRKDAETVARSDMEHWERFGLMDRWMQEVGRPPTAAMFIERYERHNENVTNFFRDKSDRILQVCWEEEANPWRRLCEFVGADVPAAPFPHANRSPIRS